MSTRSPNFKGRKGRSHLSMSGYMTMLAKIKQKRRTAAEVCKAIGRPSSSHLVKIVAWMMRLGMVHIHSWVSPSGRGKRVARFEFGPGENAPYTGIAGVEMGANMQGRPPISLIALSHMMDAMTVGATTNEVVEATGLSRGVVLRAIRHGRKIGLLRIAGYRRRSGIGGAPIPVYGLRNDGEQDATKPEAIGSTRQGQAAIRRRWKERRRIMDIMAGSPANNARHLEAA